MLKDARSHFRKLSTLLSRVTATIIDRRGPQAAGAPSIHSEPIELPAIDCEFWVRWQALPDDFAAPNPWIHVKARLPGSTVEIGTAAFCVSPLNDRIYIGDIKIEEAFRRSHYGAALVHAMVRHQEPLMPVTPIHVVFSSQEFWEALRRGRVDGVTITPQIRVSEMDQERERWGRRTQGAEGQVPARSHERAR
jgi:hypothetical protein